MIRAPAFAGDPAVAVPDAVEADDVDHAGLVLEVEERDAGGGGGALAMGDHAGDQYPAVGLVGGRELVGPSRMPRETISAAQVPIGCSSGEIPVAQRSAIVGSISTHPRQHRRWCLHCVPARWSGRVGVARRPTAPDDGRTRSRRTPLPSPAPPAARPSGRYGARGRPCRCTAVLVPLVDDARGVGLADALHLGRARAVPRTAVAAMRRSRIGPSGSNCRTSGGCSAGRDRSRARWVPPLGRGGSRWRGRRRDGRRGAGSSRRGGARRR